MAAEFVHKQSFSFKAFFRCVGKLIAMNRLFLVFRSSSNFWALDEDGNVFCALFDYDKVDGNVSGEERWDWSECIKWRPLLPTLTQQVDNHQMMSITALDYSGG